MLFFISGTLIASFMFVVSCSEKINFRFLSRRSRCDYCLKNLSWLELIPIISFLALRGKCRNCKTKLASGCLYVEIILGVSFTLPLFFTLEAEYYTHYFLIVSFLIPLSIIDYEQLIVPNHMLVLLSICSMILFPIYSSYFWLKLIIIFLILKVYPYFSKFIGFGDVKLFMILFLIFPANIFLLIFLSTFIIGGLAAIIFEVILKDKNTVYPLVPFITTAFIIVMINLKELKIIFGGLL